MTTNSPESPVRQSGLSAAKAGGAGPSKWWYSALLGQIGLPLGVSIALHVVLAVVLMYSAWTFRDGLAGGKARTEVIINIPAAPPSPTPSREAGSTEAAPPAPIQAPPPQLQGLGTREVAAPPPSLRSAGSDVLAPVDLLRRQDDAAVGATFAGLGARQATRIVYVVDASGAMVTSLKFVIAELERSVRSLSSAQKFQVILFRDRPGAEGGLYEVFSPTGGRAKLVPATAANKAALSKWLATAHPVGRSNPIDGLRRAFEFDPDAIFLLSRSIRRSGGGGGDDPGGVWGRGPQETLAELDRLNPRDGRSGRRRVVIKAIQFLEEDPTATMQRIGEEHGDGPGSYSVLTLQALGGR